MTAKKTQKAPIEPNKTKSTQSNTKVAQKAKSSQNAIQSVTEGVGKSKPTIKSLQTEIKAWELTVTTQEQAIINLQSRIIKLEDAYTALEQELVEEINRSWWDITKERVKESFYKVFGRFTSYE
jgi:predicted RNase H-like nuclease (RuvC/YqgF family)